MVLLQRWRTYRVRTERRLCSNPVSVDLPCGFGSKGRERKPVEIFVLLEVGEGDEEKAIEEGGGLLDSDARPDLVGEGVEERGLVRILEVLDGVEVLERTRGSNRALRDSVE